MPEAVYFLKRGDKPILIGPHNLATIKKLSETFRIKPNDLISQSKDGPWHKFSDAEATLYGGSSRRQAVTSSQPEAAPPPTPRPVSNPNLIARPECSAQVSKNAATCPKCGFTMIEPEAEQVGLPDFDIDSQASFISGAIPKMPTFQPTPYHAPAPIRSSKPNQDEDENLKSGPGWLLLPWRAEDGGIRYWSLKKYLLIAKFLASLIFGLLAYIPLVAIVVTFLLGLYLILFTDSENAGLGRLTIGFLTMIPIYAIWFFLCHLLYIGIMAGVDLLRCIIDIEKNTR